MQGLTFFRDRWPLFVLTLFCGSFCAMVDSIKQTNYIVFSFGYVLHAVVYMAVFVILALLGEHFLVWLNVKGERQRTRGSDVPSLLSAGDGAKGFLVQLGIILVCWLPYIILSYPGVVWYDTQQQLLQWFGFPNTFTDGTFLSDHHPVLDTAIFGVFVQLGGLLGSRDIGPFLYSIVQAIVTATSFVSVVRFSRSIGLSHRFCSFTLLFFAFFPVIPLYSIGMVKDSLFFPVFIWFFILFIKVIRSRGEVLQQNWNLILFIALALLMSLTKKTGLYIVVFSCLVAVFSLPWGRRKRMTWGFLIPTLVMTVLLPMAFFPMMHIEKGGKQEMLAIPFQQSALLVKQHGNEIPKNDLDVIYKVLGRNVGSRYQWWAADSVKGYSWDSAKNQYLLHYFRVWVKGGFEHPGTYLQAFLAMEEGWVGMPNAFDNQPDLLLMPVYVEGNNHVFTHSSELGFSNPGNQSNAKDLQQIINWLEGSPFGVMLFSRALWSSGIAIFVGYECLRKNKHRMTWLLPYLATYLFLWVSPASVTIEGMRYVIPMVIAMPLAVASLLAPEEDEGKTTDSSTRPKLAESTSANLMSSAPTPYKTTN